MLEQGNFERVELRLVMTLRGNAIGVVSQITGAGEAGTRSAMPGKLLLPHSDAKAFLRQEPVAHLAPCA